MKKIVRLSVVKNERKHAEASRLRGRLGESINHIRSHLGDDFSGYAMVSWANDGRIVTSIAKTPGGLVGTAIVPTFVKDKLEGHITEDFIIDGLTAPPKPGDAS